MAWRDQLRPASFRGVPFQVDEGEVTGGRRLQVHEYPFRDKPYSEDIGRATRGYSITGFVIGEDCLAQRDALLAACETAGPGTLIDPWLGQIQVCLREPARVSHSKAHERVVQFTLIFVEAGDLSYPSVTESTGSATLSAADLLRSASLEDFVEKFKTAGVPAFVGDDALSFGKQTLSNLKDKLSFLPDFTDAVDGVKDQLADLIGIPSSFATAILGMFAKGRPTSTDTANTTRYASQLVSVSSSTAFASPSMPTSAISATRAQQLNNTQAITELVRRSALADAATSTARMPAVVADDVLALRDKAMNALDNESLTASDPVFLALSNTRTAVYKDLTKRAQDAARLDTITPSETVPSLVLAYDLYEDAGRADEIVERNHISHPGFVPPSPVLVLSR